jgi:hypothetical protein
VEGNVHGLIRGIIFQSGLRVRKTFEISASEGSFQAYKLAQNLPNIKTDLELLRYTFDVMLYKMWHHLLLA